MKKLLSLAFVFVLSIAFSFAQCAATLTNSSTPVEPSVGFCVIIEAPYLDGNRTASVWEYWYLNPDQCDTCWHVEYNLGAQIGTYGNNKGKICYSPTWEWYALNQHYSIALMGIKSGAKFKVRSINFIPAEQYPNYPVLYTQIKNDPSKWCGFSNTITVPNMGCVCNPTEGTTSNPGKGGGKKK